MRVLLEQGGRAHQHPGRAVAALQRVVGRERLLQRAQLAVLGCEPFDGAQLGAVRLHGEEHAALHGLAGEVDRAGAAVARVAADMCSRQLEVVADEMDEQAARVDLALVRLAVDLDRDREARDRLRAHDVACSTARTAQTAARWRRYSADACTSEGGSRSAASTAARTLSASAADGRRTTGTASTQPSTMVTPGSETFAAALAMHVPSRPIVTEAKPSAAWADAGTETESSSSPSPTAVM